MSDSEQALHTLATASHVAKRLFLAQSCEELQGVAWPARFCSIFAPHRPKNCTNSLATMTSLRPLLADQLYSID